MTVPLTESSDGKDLNLSSKSSDQTQNPVWMYLREMGVVPLLTREGEVAVAKRIARGQLSVRKILSRSPIVVGELARLGVAIEDRERSIREIVTFNEDELTEQGIEKCRERIEAWRGDYNRGRPHSALGYRPPAPAAGNPYPPLSTVLQPWAVM